MIIKYIVLFRDVYLDENSMQGESDIHESLKFNSR